jgi:multidrug resistance efflux pump
MKKNLIILLITGLLLTACAQATTPAPVTTSSPDPVPSLDSVTAEGTLVPGLAAELAFSQGGVIAEVLVETGNEVSAGSVLARLAGIETIQAELAAASLEQTAAQQALDALYRNDLLHVALSEQGLLDAQAVYDSAANAWSLDATQEATDIEMAFDDYIAAEKAYRTAQTALLDLIHLDKDERKRERAEEDLAEEKGALTKTYDALKQAIAENAQPLSQDQALLLKGIASLEMARENRDRITEENIDADQLSAAQARLNAATAQRNAIETALQFYEIRAPFDGTVFSENLSAGEIAIPGQPVIFIAGASEWIVETKDLSEIEISKVSTGQSVKIMLDAFPDAQFSGEVIAVNPVGLEYLGDTVYKVTIQLNETNSKFLWNMTATVSIEPTFEQP